MPRLKKVRDPVERLVVHQDGAEQRLLQLDVVRRGTIKRRSIPRLLAYSRFERHGVPRFGLISTAAQQRRVQTNNAAVALRNRRADPLGLNRQGSKVLWLQ